MPIACGMCLLLVECVYSLRNVSNACGLCGMLLYSSVCYSSRRDVTLVSDPPPMPDPPPCPPANFRKQTLTCPTYAGACASRQTVGGIIFLFLSGMPAQSLTTMMSINALFSWPWWILSRKYMLEVLFNKVTRSGNKAVRSLCIWFHSLNGFQIILQDPPCFYGGYTQPSLRQKPPNIKWVA